MVNKLLTCRNVRFAHISVHKFHVNSYRIIEIAKSATKVSL